jgi:hypothetical protein
MQIEAQNGILVAGGLAAFPSEYILLLSGEREWCAPLPDSFQACENCSLLRWNLRGEIQIAEASRAHQAGVNKRDIQCNQ